MNKFKANEEGVDRLLEKGEELKVQSKTSVLIARNTKKL